MNKTLSAIGVSLLLSGCSSYWENMSGEATQTNRSQPEPGVNVQVVDVTGEMSADTSSSREYSSHSDAQDYGAMPAGTSYGKSKLRGALLNRHVGDYVQSMTQDLISNMEYLTDKTPVGVTNFALIDSDLQQTNILGFQLAESFIHELHKFRIPVIDFKATDYIRVTEQGDFLLTRDYLELTEEAPIEYILTGTMTKHQGGVLINARILGLKSKAVVATAQMLMPMHAAEALMPSEHNLVDGVQLTQGDE